MGPTSSASFRRILDIADPEAFVRAALTALEFDFRELALVALSEWGQVGIVAPELFRAVAALQRPSWGHWNGVIGALRAARKSVLRAGDPALRERIEAARPLAQVLDLWDTPLPANVNVELLARAAGSRESRLTVGACLALPITIRNRVAHSPPGDWTEFALALRPLVAALADGTLTPPEFTGERPPWIVVEDGERRLFSGVDDDFRLTHQSRSGQASTSAARSGEFVESLQRLLGRERSRDANLRRWLTQFATDDVKGVMLGDYLVGPPVGSGGFATVHRGVQLSTGRRVAVKILRDELRDSMGVRFQREAEYLARFSHRSIVAAIEHGEEPWIAPRTFDLSGEEWYRDFAKSSPVKSFLVMEWIDGRTLEEIFAAAPRPDSKTLCGWMADLADALATVHATGLIHRDIKPGNVMITPEGRAVLTDFGIARPRDDTRTLKTSRGQVLGTPAYMAPEQIRAANAEDEVGPEADIYALCATFYELFTGVRLFRHDTETAATVETRKLSGERPVRPRKLLRSLPWEFDTILMGGLEPIVVDRYRSARDLERDLRLVLRDEPIRYRRPSLWRRGRLFYRRHRLPVSLVAVFAVLTIAGITQYIRDIAEEQRQTKLEQGRTLDERNRATTRLDQQYVLNASRLMDEGRWLDSLPWLTEALSLHLSMETDDPQDKRREHVHRTRLGILFRETPNLLHLWADQSGGHGAFSPDGALYATGDYQGVARVFRTATGELVAEMRQENPQWSDAVNDVVFSPDSKLLATAAGDTSGRNGKGSARIWDALTGRPVTPRLEHEGNEKPQERKGATDYIIKGAGAVLQVAFSPDGGRLYSSSDSGTIRIWDTATGELLLQPLAHPDEVDYFEVSSDGARIVSQNKSQTWLWNTTDGAAIGEPVSDVPFRTRPRFSPDGSSWATVSGQQLQLRNSSDGSAVRDPVLLNVRDPILSFSSDSRQLLVGSQYGLEPPRLLTIEDGTWQQTDFPNVGKLDEEPAYRPDGNRVLVRSEDGARLCDPQVGRPVGSILDAERFSPTGPFLASRSGLWQLPNGSTQRIDGDLDQSITSVISDDGTWFVTWPYDGNVARLHQHVESDDGLQRRTVELSHDQPMSKATFAVASGLLATGSGSERRSAGGQIDPTGTVRLWSLATGQPVGEPLTQPEEIEQLALAPDGRSVATISKEKGVLRLWTSVGQRAGGAFASVDIPQSMPVTAVGFSPDSTTLAYILGTERPSAAEAAVWEIGAGRERLHLPKRDVHGRRVDWIGNDRFVVNGSCWVEYTSRVDRAELWNADTGESLTGLQDAEAAADPRGATVLFDSTLHDARSGDVLHEIAGRDLAYSRDGSRLVSRSPSVRVFDVATGQPLTPAFATSNATHAAFSPNGLLIVTIAGPTSLGFSPIPELRIWDAHTGEPASPGFQLLGTSADSLRIRDDGSRVYVYGGHGAPTLTTLSLAPELRPLSALRAEAEWKAGLRIDETANLSTIDRVARATSREAAAVSVAEVNQRWYATEAAVADAARRFTVALWHRERQSQSGEPQPELLLDIADSQVELQRWGPAVKTFDAVLSMPGWSIDRFSAEESHAFARALAGTGDFARAAEVCAQIEPRIDDRDFLILYAGVLVELGRHADANDVFDRHGTFHLMFQEYRNHLDATRELEHWPTALMLIRLERETGHSPLGELPRQLRDYFASLVTAEPDNDRWRRELIRADQCLDESRSVDAGALPQCDAFLAHIEKLPLSDRDNAAVVGSAARHYTDVLTERADALPAAERLRRIDKLIAVLEELGTQHEGDTAWLWDRARLQIAAGDLEYSREQMEVATERYESALELYLQLAAGDDSDDSVRYCRDRLASAYWERKEKDRARQELELALGNAERREASIVAARSRTDEVVFDVGYHNARETLAYSLKRLAGLEESLERFQEARTLWERAVTIEAGLKEDSPHGQDEPVVQSRTLARLARVCNKLNDHQAEEAHLRAAIARRKEGYASAPVEKAEQLSFLLSAYWRLFALLETAEMHICLDEGRALIPPQEQLKDFDPDAVRTVIEFLGDAAWMLATSPDDTVRDPARAVEFALQASDIAGSGDPDMLDTLAAAYAAAGRFDEAVTTAESALRLLAEDAPERVEYRSRLDLYLAGKPYHMTR